MKNKTLKNLALFAKNRLIQKAGNVVSPISSSNITFKLMLNEDDAFFEKVKNLLEENSISPIRELMDKKRYDSLDEFGKQKYLLDTVERFQEMKRKIECENSRKLVY